MKHGDGNLAALNFESVLTIVLSQSSRSSTKWDMHSTVSARRPSTLASTVPPSREISSKHRRKCQSRPLSLPDHQLTLRDRLENWCWVPELLKKMSMHFETKEQIPDSVIKSIVASKSVNQGLFNLRQLFHGRYDMLVSVRSRSSLIAVSPFPAASRFPSLLHSRIRKPLLTYLRAGPYLDERSGSHEALVRSSRAGFAGFGWRRVRRRPVGLRAHRWRIRSRILRILVLSSLFRRFLRHDLQGRSDEQGRWSAVSTRDLATGRISRRDGVAQSFPRSSAVCASVHELVTWSGAASGGQGVGKDVDSRWNGANLGVITL